MIAALALVFGAALSANASPLKIDPVPAVNVTQYLGRWYQIAASLTVNATFEAGTVCVAANYDVNPNGTIGVHNTARNGSPSGTPNDIDGWASAEDPTKPAALTVHLQGVPVAAPYWVIMLGEPEVPGGPYQYSIVSDPLEATLFVLARNITKFNQVFLPVVYDKLNKLGYNQFYNKPITTSQEGCW